jgi:hypothetical protein
MESAGKANPKRVEAGIQDKREMSQLRCRAHQLREGRRSQPVATAWPSASGDGVPLEDQSRLRCLGLTRERLEVCNSVGDCGGNAHRGPGSYAGGASFENTQCAASVGQPLFYARAAGAPRGEQCLRSNATKTPNKKQQQKTTMDTQRRGRTKPAGECNPNRELTMKVQF